MGGSSSGIHNAGVVQDINFKKQDQKSTAPPLALVSARSPWVTHGSYWAFQGSLRGHHGSPGDHQSNTPTEKQSMKVKNLKKVSR